MRVEMHAARVYSRVTGMHDETRRIYASTPEVPLFVCMIDLADNSNYRIVKGPEAGYIRGEKLFHLMSATIAPAREVRIAKELGDGALLVADAFRPLLEAILIMDLASGQIRAGEDEQDFPFRVRFAVGFGDVKRLQRRHEDYLGTAIDELSRVALVRAEDSNILIDHRAYEMGQRVLAEYSGFLRISDERMLSDEESRGLRTNVYYRRVFVDQRALAGFSDYFASWD